MATSRRFLEVMAVVCVFEETNVCVSISCQHDLYIRVSGQINLFSLWNWCKPVLFLSNLSQSHAFVLWRKCLFEKKCVCIMLGSRRTFRSFLFYTNQLALVNECFYILFCYWSTECEDIWEKNKQAERLFISLTCIRYILAIRITCLFH